MVKWLIRAVGAAVFAAVAVYGLTRFLAASETRRIMADGERACAAHGGIDTIAAADGLIEAFTCEDGTVILPST